MNIGEYILPLGEWILKEMNLEAQMNVGWKIMGSGDIMGAQIRKNPEDSGLSWGIRMFLNFAISNALKMHFGSYFYQNFIGAPSPNPRRCSTPTSSPQLRLRHDCKKRDPADPRSMKINKNVLLTSKNCYLSIRSIA